MDPIGLDIKILENIVSPELQRALLPLKIVFIAVFLTFLVLIIWLLKKSSYKDFLMLDWWRDYKLLKSIRAGELDEAEEAPKKDIPEVKLTDWQRVIEKLKTKDELKCKLALIDADRLLDRELRLKNRDLNSLANAEKIEKIKDYLSRLLEKPNKGITFRNAKNIVSEYKKALKETEAI